MSATDFDLAEDATALKWRYEEHCAGEIARFDVCGLYAWARDCDGDFAVWTIRKGRGGPVLAEGQTRDFFPALHEAEAALRKIVADRIAELRTPVPLAQPSSIGGQ